MDRLQELELKLNIQREVVADAEKRLRRVKAELSAIEEEYNRLLLATIAPELKPGAQLAFTTEFKSIVRQYGNYVELYEEPLTLRSYYHQHDRDYCFVNDATGGATGNIPLEVVRRMRQAWLSENGGESK